MSASSSSCFFFTIFGTIYCNHLRRLSKVGIWLQSRLGKDSRRTYWSKSPLGLTTQTLLRYFLRYPSQPVPTIGAVFSLVGATCSDFYCGSLTTRLALVIYPKPLVGAQASLIQLRDSSPRYTNHRFEILSRHGHPSLYAPFREEPFAHRIAQFEGVRELR